MSDPKQFAMFEDRFMESFVGKAIVADKKIALIELIANAWDAGATRVEIDWPLKYEDAFKIRDNGHGMSNSDFKHRFMVLAYNRQRHQGIFAEIPKDNESLISSRPAFGKSGKGRFAGFAFGETFNIKTWRDNTEIHYLVVLDSSNLPAFKKISESEAIGHGTEIFIENSYGSNITVAEIKAEIGMRFVVDPNFEIKINGEIADFNSIPEENVDQFIVELGSGETIEIFVIDTKSSDRTTHQHGVAWHVNNRLVGECTWKGSGNEYLIDGRRSIAKQYAFIVKANCLSDCVLPDWTDFNRRDKKYIEIFAQVQSAIKVYLLDLYKENRESTFKDVEAAAKPDLDKIGVVGREKWEKFVSNVQEECPSIAQDDLQKIALLLAKLERTESKYNLISVLSDATPNQLDDLNDILKKWNVDFVKLVLDELEYRMTLVEKLRMRISNKNTDEVLELQPLFHRGLWIFGPEFETIEYTSNVGMTKVIQTLFNTKDSGSRNRPDFAILKDSSVGLYSYPKYDRDGGEIGVDKLVIVELKKPGIPIGEEEKSQPWKYVKELINKGYLTRTNEVSCFVLGTEIDPSEVSPTEHNDKMVRVTPLVYDTILTRANSRLLKLFDKVKESPFLADTRLKEFLREKNKQDAAQLLLPELIEQSRAL